MPIKKSAKKYMKSSSKRRAQNDRVKKTMRELVKKVRDEVKTQDWNKAQESLPAAIRAIDKASQKKVIKKNTAARKKSRLIASLKNSRKSNK